MLSSLLPSLKSSLLKANTFRQPIREAVDVFLKNLNDLLHPLNIKGDAQGEKFLLLEFLRDIFFLSFDNQETENKSPVCYANASGLRPGFEDPFSGRQPTLKNLDNNWFLGKDYTKPFKIHQPLKETLQVIPHTLILIIKELNPLADVTKLEQEVARLIYQLYSLTPEEIDFLKEQAP
ncbi:MAG: hypothetical protein M3Q05_14075 [Bacteroidota bacterium]|nr:hypothetical protein [Bacteroidota bacterium]